MIFGRRVSGCPSAAPGSLLLHHMRCECPLRTAQACGSPLPGWDMRGNMHPADWEGPVTNSFPHGSNLTNAAAQRLQAYVATHGLVVSKHALGDRANHSRAAPRRSGGSRP